MCAAMQNIVDMMKVITVVRSLAYIQNIQGMAWVIPHKPRLHHRDGRHTTRQTTKTNIHKPTCITWIIYHLSLSPYIHLSQFLYVFELCQVSFHCLCSVSKFLLLLSAVVLIPSAGFWSGKAGVLVWNCTCLFNSITSTSMTECTVADIITLSIHRNSLSSKCSLFIIVNWNQKHKTYVFVTWNKPK